MKKDTIYPLTSLRFLFAFAVFLAHLQISWETDTWGNLQPLMREGFIGVSFFYILSGFILSYNYESKLLSGDISRKEFYIARVARIWPMHLVTLLFCLPLATAGNDATGALTKLTLNIFMLHSLIPIRDYFYSFNVPSWSISNEFIFYLLFPLLIPIVKKGRGAYVGVALYFLLFLGSLFIASTWDKNLQRGFFYINPLFRFTDFLIGVLLFGAYQKFKSLSARISSRGASLIEMACLVILAAAVAAKGHFREIYRFSPYYWMPMALIIFAFAHGKGVFSKMLSNRILVLLGEISFSFYLWHYVVISYVETLDERFHFSRTENVLLCFTVSIGLSYLSHRFIEKPANAYIRRLGKKARKDQNAPDALPEPQQEPLPVLLPQDAAK